MPLIFARSANIYRRDIRHCRRCETRRRSLKNILSQSASLSCAAKAPAVRLDREVKGCCDDLTTSARGKCALCSRIPLQGCVSWPARNGLTTFWALRYGYEAREKDIFRYIRGEPNARKITDERRRASARDKKTREKSTPKVRDGTSLFNAALDYQYILFLCFHTRKTRTYQKCAEYDSRCTVRCSNDSLSLSLWYFPDISRLIFKKVAILSPLLSALS